MAHVVQRTGGFPVILVASNALLLLSSVIICVAAAASIGEKEDNKIDDTSTNAEINKQQNKPIFRYDYGAEQHADFWLKGGEAALIGQLEKRLETGVAKNVILFIGDGMSVPTLTAARIYAGQLEKKDGENGSLSFEKFPHMGLAKTYCVDSQVADSACSATAYLAGVKTNKAMLGVTANAKMNNCLDGMDKKNQVTSILEWAQQANKSTGIVTTTRVTHATPAGAYAHSSYRHWESDRDLHKHDQHHSCSDIAKQLIRETPGKDINVILGGGKNKFQPQEYAEKGRLDKVNLIKEWAEDKERRGLNYKYVETPKQLKDVELDKTDYLLGLFTQSHFQYALNAKTDSQPTLTEMTAAAIEVLSHNENGYFLLVEGGLIDMAHHANKAHLALHETVEFAKAVEQAVAATDASDTLIVVTSDHSHSMSHSGYPPRGAPLFGAAGYSDVDRLPVSILSYANGPGQLNAYDVDGHRHSFWKDRIDENYRFPATFPLNQARHGGDDVAVFARGPWSHLLVGSYEQNLIPLVMGYAACIGPKRTLCEENLDL